MDAPFISVSACGPDITPLSWNSKNRLRIGRLPELEVVLPVESVSRQHAEFLHTSDGWVVRDLGSSNGTDLNNARLGRTGQRVRVGDVVRIGRVEMRVDVVRDHPAEQIRTGSQVVRVESETARPWHEAIGRFEPTGDQWAQSGRGFMKLMRGGYQLSHARTLKEGLQAVLDDAVAVFGAQRGGVFLPDATGGELVVCCTAVPPGRNHAVKTPSQTLAGRAFRRGRSLLYADCHADTEVQGLRSVTQGGMASIICAVLRSPEGPVGVLHLDRGPFQMPFTEADLEVADSLAAALALGVERQQLVDRQQALFAQTVTALAEAVEMRDRYTGSHTHRVTGYSLMLAEEMRLPAAERQLLRLATPLHDIGKIAVDDAVLRKPGRLTDAEFGQMKTHVLRGVDIIRTIPGLARALPVVRSHHERWDGTGYPDGLRGDDIPLLARVVAVADAFDAMTSDRPYRRGMSADAAFDELVAGAGKQFDPRCVEAFLRIRPAVETALRQEATVVRYTDGSTKTMSRQELDQLLSAVKAYQAG